MPYTERPSKRWLHALPLAVALPLSAWSNECVVAAPAAAPVSTTSACLQGNGPREILSGSQLELTRPIKAQPDGRIFDARNARWSGYDSAGKEINWAITLRGDYDDGCWYGGRVRGAWNDLDPSVTWADPYHRSGAFSIEVDNFLLQAVNVRNHGDGIITDADDVTIADVYLTDIHDDCVQNDKLKSLVIEDSLFDGCYVGFSARPNASDNRNGSGNHWQIRDSLLRLQAQPVVWKPQRLPAPGHGPFLKFDFRNRSPRLSITNTIFRADQYPNHGKLGIPPEVDLKTCANNTIVWLGDGPFPDGDLLPDCFRVTTDIEVWNRAVDRWKDRHPDVI